MKRDCTLYIVVSAQNYAFWSHIQMAKLAVILHLMWVETLYLVQNVTSNTLFSGLVVTYKLYWSATS